MKLQPGQFFRNTDSQRCIQRIKAAKVADLDDLHAALITEKLSARPRRKLCKILIRQINQLDQDKI